MRQLNWTILHQCFQENLHFLNQALTQKVSIFDPKPSTLIKCIEDFLEGTSLHLIYLDLLEYHISPFEA